MISVPKDFSHLTIEEQECIKYAPINVAILIASADGVIDKLERNEITRIISKKSDSSSKEVANYFNWISKNHEIAIDNTIKNLPNTTDKTIQKLSLELETLNNIFKRLDSNVSLLIYENLKEIALSIAKASGGLSDYLSICYEEAMLIKLDMINKPQIE